MSSKMGYVGSKNRSLGQISEKPCVRTRGHNFCLIIMKHGQNVCLHEISHEFTNVSSRIKTRSLGQILEKPCVCSRALILVQIPMKLGQNVCIDDF